MEKKYKRGDVREDGMVFRNYNCRGEEWWVTPEELEMARRKDKEARKAYCKRHPDRVKKTMKNWNAKNPGRNAEIAREWRKNNREYVNSVAREWQRKNPDKVKASRQRTIEKNKEAWLAERRIARAKRRALIAKKTHSLHDRGIEKCLVEQCQRLTKCLGIKFELDHIDPIDGNGWHYHINLHCIPAVWNRRKSTKHCSILPSCWIKR